MPGRFGAADVSRRCPSAFKQIFGRNFALPPPLEPRLCWDRAPQKSWFEERSAATAVKG